MAEVVKGFKPTIYRCSKCGVTSETYKNWGPICPETGERVCDVCCWKCKHHIAWSGIWRCGYRSREDRMSDARKKAQDRFNAENEKISAAYHTRRKEEARLRAIKRARAKARRKSY
jgi:hypothetical protein